MYAVLLVSGRQQLSELGEPSQNREDWRQVLVDPWTQPPD